MFFLMKLLKLFGLIVLNIDLSIELISGLESSSFLNVIKENLTLYEVTNKCCVNTRLIEASRESFGLHALVDELSKGVSDFILYIVYVLLILIFNIVIWNM